MCGALRHKSATYRLQGVRKMAFQSLAENQREKAGIKICDISHKNSVLIYFSFSGTFTQNIFSTCGQQIKVKVMWHTEIK